MTLSRSATKNATTSPTIIDVHVGNRIRLRRMTLGLPMTEVAKNVGVSWQQLEKYERARDRTSASMLYLISSALGVTVDFFFAELPRDATSEPAAELMRMSDIADVLTPDARGRRVGRLIASFWRIGDAKQRRHVLGLMRALADQAERPQPDINLRRDPV